MGCKQVNFRSVVIRFLVSFSFQCRFFGKEQATLFGSLEVWGAGLRRTILWLLCGVLRSLILPVVWFQYYRGLEDFTETTQGDSTLYLHITVFLPFDIIFYEHTRLTVYRMFYFLFFLRRIGFRLLFVQGQNNNWKTKL